MNLRSKVKLYFNRYYEINGFFSLTTIFFIVLSFLLSSSLIKHWQKLPTNAKIYFSFITLVILLITILIFLFKHLMALDYLGITRGITHRKEYDRFLDRLYDFRVSVNNYYNKLQIITNDPIQEKITQAYLSILNLQKKRLIDKKIKIVSQVEQERISIQHSDMTVSLFSDEKYEINQVMQQVRAISTYWRENNLLFRRSNNGLAYTTFLRALHPGGGTVACPNCGHKANRENLLDGCDYCKAKFTVEDLAEEKIHSMYFSNGIDKRIMKLSNNFVSVWKSIFFLSFAPWFLLANAFMIPDYLSLIKRGKEISLIKFPFTHLSDFIVPFIITFIIFAGFYLIFIRPILKKIYSIKDLEVKHTWEKENEKQVEIAVREQDPLFSLSIFYGNIANKLYGIHFADHKKEINSFSNCDLSEYLDQYQSLIDVEINKIMLSDYQVTGQKQTAKVFVSLTLVKEKNDRIKIQNEELFLLLQRNKECLSQIIANPHVVSCKFCGSNVSYLDGKSCKYCQNEIFQQDYDWVIKEYEILPL